MAKITIITLGESGVGKTSLLTRFRTGKFKETTRSTFVDHFSKAITVENIKTNAVIWDTAGQERYNSLIKRYYAMADGVLLVYDVNDALTFSKLSRWLSELRSENETAQTIIVGNKSEDSTKKLVSSSEVQNFAQKENLQHIEISAKTGHNVDLIFQTLIKKILIAKGILPQEHQPISQGTTKSSNIRNEPDISFSYIGQSERSGNSFPEETNRQELIDTDEDKASKLCYPCRWS